MHTQTALPEKVELYLPHLDSHILIQNNADGVVIRATRNNISGKQKEFLIRHLAAEGYIPDRYEWFFEPAGDGFFGVTWIANGFSGPKRTWGHCISKWCTRRNVWYG